MLSYILPSCPTKGCEGRYDETFGGEDDILHVYMMLAFYLCLRKEFNNFNNTGARMVDSIYHVTFKLLKNRIFLD